MADAEGEEEHQESVSAKAESESQLPSLKKPKGRKPKDPLLAKITIPGSVPSRYVDQFETEAKLNMQKNDLTSKILERDY